VVGRVNDVAWPVEVTWKLRVWLLVHGYQIMEAPVAEATIWDQSKDVVEWFRLHRLAHLKETDLLITLLEEEEQDEEGGVEPIKVLNAKPQQLPVQQSQLL
jgi:hypothetical protein